jgi:hypothetical protein
VVVETTVDGVVDNCRVLEVGTVVVVTTVEIGLVPLLVGGRNSKTKAVTMPTPATTARILARTDHLVSPDLSSSGGGGGGSASGGGP